MATLKELISATAQTLGDPEKSVHVHAMHLRRAKLLSSAGRGVHSARMGPADATNLLLACLHSGKAKHSVDVVKKLREAKKRKYAVIAGANTPETGLPTSSAIEALPRKHTLGVMLDTIFMELSSKGKLVERITSKPYSLSLSLTTSPSKWSAALSFLARYSDWQLQYDQSRREAEPDNGLKQVTVQVPHACLQAIADCIADKYRASRERLK